MGVASAAETDSLFYYSWPCGDQTRECSLRIDHQLVAYYREDREHVAYRYSSADLGLSESSANFSGFMFSQPGMSVVEDLVRQLVNDTMTVPEKIQSALTFVQELPYARDKDSKHQEEYVRYPVETLVDRTGDCEDKVMLLGAIFGVMDMDFIILKYPDHLAIGIQSDELEGMTEILYEGKRYLYLETTAPHWEIGSIPEEYVGSEIEVYRPQTTPALIVKGVWFETSPAALREKADCTLKLDLFNSGPDDIVGFHLELQFVWKRLLSGDSVTEASFALDDLREGETRMTEVTFKSPISQDAVLFIRLVGDNISDQSLELRME